MYPNKVINLLVLLYYQSSCNDLPFLGFIHLKVNVFIDKLKIPFNPLMPGGNKNVTHT